MEKVKFERHDPDQEFKKGDEIYVIDKNKYDIWRAVVKKSSSKGFLVHYEDFGQEDKKYAGTKRFLLRTDRNNAIYEQQEKKRNGSKDSAVEGEVTPGKQQKTNLKQQSKEGKAKREKKAQKKENNENDEKTGKKENNNPKKKIAEKKKVIKKTDTKVVNKKKKAAPNSKKKKSSFSDSEDELSESESDGENFENDEDDENDEDISNDDDSNDDDDETELKLNDIKSADIDKSKDEDEDDDKNGNDDVNVKSKAVKKPIIDNHTIVRNAWGNGIHDVDAFRTYMMDNLDTAVSEFEKLYKMNNVSEFPPFSLGGPIESKEISHFWLQAQSLWKRFFGDLEVVSTKDFLKKSVPYFKLPNQREANARDAMMFIFDPENQPETDFVQFCAFLASFGPPCTAIRKIGHWLKCPPELKDALLFPDIPVPSSELPEDAEMNLFTLKTNIDEDHTKANEKNGNDTNETNETNDGDTDGTETEKWVYNLPYVSTEGEYLVDTDGVTYKDWLDYFEKNESLVRKVGKVNEELDNQ